MKEEKNRSSHHTNSELEVKLGAFCAVILVKNISKRETLSLAIMITIAAFIVAFTFFLNKLF